jgi:hypothetical protein
MNSRDVKVLVTRDLGHAVTRSSLTGVLTVATRGLHASPLSTSLLFLSWCFTLFATSRLKSGVLEPQYTDYLRHASYGLEFLRSGFGIYSKLAREITPIAGHMVWPDAGYLYPPAALLVFSPLTLAIRFGVQAEEAARWFVVALVTIAHIAAHELNTGLRERMGSPVLRGTMVMLFVSFGAFWSLNGQFDVVPALFIILAGNAKSNDRCLMWSAAALAVKFQSLLVVPYVIARLAVSLTGDRSTRPKPLTLGIVGVSLASVLPALYVLRDQLSPALQNRVAWNQWGPAGVMFTGATVIVVAYALLERDWLEAAVLLLTYAAISVVAQFQMWYMVIPLGLLVHYQRPRRWELHAAWILGFCLALQWWPNPLRAWQLIFAA